MKSLGQMIKQIAGLEGTKDVSRWENDFIHGIVVWSSNGEKTGNLSTKQVEVIERIYQKHFA